MAGSPLPFTLRSAHDLPPFSPTFILRVSSLQYSLNLQCTQVHLSFVWLSAFLFVARHSTQLNVVRAVHVRLRIADELVV